jgi:hypothetical protein
MTGPLSPTQARTVGRVLRAELRRLRERSEAASFQETAPQVTLTDAESGGGRCG